MTAHPSSGRGDKDDRYGLVSVEEECIGQCTDSRLSRGSGPDQQPHQDPEIMASDVDQVALVDIFTSAQPGPAHAASIEIMGEGPLDDFRPPSHRLLAKPGTKAGAVRIDRRTGFVVAMPA